MRPRWHAAIVHENVTAMSGTDTTTLWERVHERVRESDWAITANDGVIATAGLLEGFSGAGAGDQLLLLVATAATIAGGLSAGGAKWAEVAAPRESELDLVDEEVARIASQPEVEQAGLAAYWQECGLTPELAREVAARLTAKNALAAQLDADHGLEELTSPRAAWLSGLETMLAFMAGADIPLLMTFLAPVDVEISASALPGSLAKARCLFSREVRCLPVRRAHVSISMPNTLRPSRRRGHQRGSGDQSGARLRARHRSQSTASMNFARAPCSSFMRWMRRSRRRILRQEWRTR